MCVYFQKFKFGIQAPLVETGLTVWQKNECRAKAWSAISYILLISTFSLHGKKRNAANSIFWMCFHFQNIKFGVQVPLVEIGLTVWQKNGGRTKAWSTISYIFLISTFSLHGKKGMQPTTFFECAFIFKTSNLASKPPWKP